MKRLIVCVHAHTCTHTRTHARTHAHTRAHAHTQNIVFEANFLKIRDRTGMGMLATHQAVYMY
jgi:hypothetical protein